MQPTSCALLSHLRSSFSLAPYLDASIYFRPSLPHPAMSLTLPIPSSPSSTSSDSPNAPQTPMSPNHPIPTLALSPSDQSSAPSTTNSSPTPLGSVNPQAKRKPSRRANTAERRATHNAVERQRRETLNGRFLVRVFFTYFLALAMQFLTKLRLPSKGPRRSPSQSFSDSPPLQVGNSQFFHRSYSCLSPPPCHGFP